MEARIISRVYEIDLKKFDVLNCDLGFKISRNIIFNIDYAGYDSSINKFYIKLWVASKNSLNNCCSKYWQCRDDVKQVYQGGHVYGSTIPINIFLSDKKRYKFFLAENIFLEFNLKSYLQLVGRFIYTTNYKEAIKDKCGLIFYVGNDINVVKEFSNERIIHDAKIVSSELFLHNCSYLDEKEMQKNVLGRTKNKIRMLDINEFLQNPNILNKYKPDDYIMFVDNRVLINPECIRDLQKINSDSDVLINGFNVLENNKFIVRVRRTQGSIEHENIDYALYGVCLKNSYIKNCKDIEDVYEKLIDAAADNCTYTEIDGYSINLTSGNEPCTKIIPFYLPQYHECEENNKGWGKGFTEGDNVKRATPQFRNHNQPRVPSGLGYYDLDDISTQKAQIDLASKFNVYGFCYYYYGFAGKKVLDKPLSRLLEHKDLSLPFCICGANESGTRSGDGLKKDILLEQVHNEETDEKFIKEILPVMKDPRYIKVDGCPLLLIYRINLFENPELTIQRGRDICRDNGIDTIKVGLVKAFDCIENKHYDADFAIEFPPHNVFQKKIENDTICANRDFNGFVFDYKYMVEHQDYIQYRGYNFIAGTMLQGDNTARRMNESNSGINFSPELFRRGLIRNQIYTLIYEPSKLMFFNAWNEWAEGTYLEPDKKYGTKFLEIISEVSKMR